MKIPLRPVHLALPALLALLALLTPSSYSSRSEVIGET
jgi:hypothetical protein